MVKGVDSDLFSILAKRRFGQCLRVCFPFFLFAQDHSLLQYFVHHCSDSIE